MAGELEEPLGGEAARGRRVLEHPLAPQEQGRRRAGLDQDPDDRLVVAARLVRGAGVEGERDQAVAARAVGDDAGGDGRQRRRGLELDRLGGVAGRRARQRGGHGPGRRRLERRREQGSAREQRQRGQQRSMHRRLRVRRADGAGRNRLAPAARRRYHELMSRVSYQKTDRRSNVGEADPAQR